MSEKAGSPTAARVRALREAKPRLDPWGTPATRLDEERLPGGGLGPFLTVFLTGAECPFTCVFCDLWRHTLDAPTPAGALTAQLRAALAELPAGALAETGVKLYNASNFFEPRAVPAGDTAEMAGLLAPAPRVVVESHPRLVGEECLAFADALGGRLEVAMGLETVHPEALPRLGKAMTLADFDGAARRLAAAGIGLRAFVLVGAPFVPPGEGVEWAVRSARHAFEVGAGVVSLIPVRGGNGALEELERRGYWRAPVLAELEEALDRALEAAREVTGGRGVVQVDPWDLAALAAGEEDGAERLERLARLNRSGEPEPRIGATGPVGAG